VPLDSTVEVDFSEEMATSTLRLSSTPPISFSLISWTPETHRALFLATAAWAEGTQYTISAEGTDLAGNPLGGGASFTFTTVPPGPDTTAPNLLSTSPAQDEFGVAKDSHMKLTFSEPMNKTSVEQGFYLSPMPVSIIWNASGTEVEFIPASPFPYGTDFYWTVAGATDLAGNSLGSVFGHFRTIRHVIYSLGAGASALVSTEAIEQTSPWAIGDDSSNRPYHGFASFSFQPLPSMGPVKIVSAVLNWSYMDPGIGPFRSLGNFVVEPVNYGNVPTTIYGIPSVGAPLLLNYTDFNTGVCSFPVTAMVTDAWANRASRSNSLQLRLKFEYTTDNDSSPDSLLIDPASLVVQVTCEHP
jgi:hypothetical protein